MVFTGKLNGRPVTVLIDSGGESNFVSADFVKRWNIEVLKDGRRVVMPDGIAVASGVAPNLFLTIGSWIVACALAVCPLASVDVILGMPWLDYYDPLVLWRAQSVAFEDDEGVTHTWTGQDAAEHPDLVHCQPRTLAPPHHHLVQETAPASDEEGRSRVGARHRSRRTARLQLVAPV